MENWTIPPDPYKQLGLERNSTPIQIKKRYYHLARKYHPNRNAGPDESNKALSEHFTRIHDAWLLLQKANLRKRYLEFIQLVELHDELLDKQEELGNLDERESDEEDWSSSDADESEISHLSSVDKTRSPVGDGQLEINGSSQQQDDHHAVQSTYPGAQRPRGREPDRRKTHPPFQNVRLEHKREGSDGQSIEHRRHKLSRRWKKELQAFDDYKEAVMVKLRAEEEMEKRKEHYERAREKRQKVEKSPKEAIEAVQMSRHVLRAAKLFKRGKPRLPRRPTLSLRSQILSAGDPSRDPGYLTVGSPSTTRGLSSHWRGYSSDVTGDQTSSDDDGSVHGAPRRSLRSPSASSRKRSPIAMNAGAHGCDSPMQAEDVNRDQRSHPKPPFQLLVKRPTGLGDTSEYAADDSSGESNSIGTFPSRSSSPHGLNHCRDLILFPSDNSTGLATNAPGHRRTMSAPGQTVLRKESDPDMSRPHHQGIMFEVKIVNETKFHDRIPESHVYKLTLDEESRLLKPPPDFGTFPDDLLQKLTLFDPDVAERFVVKSDVKSKFAFRLICSNQTPIRQQIPSFVALSYRRKRLVEKHDGYYTLPLDKSILQAVWDERVSDDEGLWVDQISIDQNSDDEKTISMSAMDMVYRSARLVVVVLDDVELREHEAKVLETHIKEYEQLKHVVPDKRFRRYQPPYLERNKPLAQVLQKILTSAWFRRAWCRHEMRLARDHVFLLPCHTAGSFEQTVLRLTSACIAHLLALATEVPFDASIEMLKPALHAFFRDRTSTSIAASPGLHHGNFSNVVAEVFAMETGGDPRLPAAQRDADARRDKVSIILNTMECGLALHPRLRSSQIALSKEDCYYSLLLLALAAGDPGALCSVGKPMHLPLAHSAQHSAQADRTVCSWLFEPTNVDSGLNNYKTLNRLASDQKVQCGISRGSHFVQLDLKFLPLSKASSASQHEEILGLAKDFVSACEKRKLGRHRRRYLMKDLKANELFGSMRDVYIETLTCVFMCGPDWMEQVAHRYGVSRFRQDLQPATWLMVALRNMNGTWPKAEWVTRGAGFIIDLVNFLVIRGMPQRQLRYPEAWRPITVATSNGGRIVTFRPPGDDVQLTVPTVLLNADYDHLARLWMVASRTTESKWMLLGKSVMFSDDLGLLQVTDEGDMVRRQQKVYGRT